MSRIAFLQKLVRQVNPLMAQRLQPYATMLQSTVHNPTNSPQNMTIIPQLPIGQNIPRKDKITFLVNSLTVLSDNKQLIYSTLDAWIAWERDFPIGAIKNVILALEKQNQWHRVIQVIKWMLSKGQGTTRGTYGQLIEALDRDNRVEEANEVWKKKLAFDLHSVPWKLCKMMISVYYRNNMLEELVGLFEGLEDFDRKPPEKSIVQKVANAYEVLGLVEEKRRVLDKYKGLFEETSLKKARRGRRLSQEG
ncbi:pentatricopeptide repeat (PPR) superfamily protein [Striga asiatica]|uniref:Pentatricopeptide repeat (PPR) superfamily protein n=1 Tax=Striga asiatica TaxID=4170 RepID=A0A5A7PH64_STRAF|nr:pentatricopeptide repeat (PPR) superfamily protein [Striga asiatica]